MVTSVHELVEWSQKVEARLVEAHTELTEKITALEEALGSQGELSEETLVALDSLSDWADRLADVVPNAPPVDPVDPPAAPDPMV